MLLPLLAGCESEAEIAAEMERGLRSANEALVGALFAAETLAPVAEPVDAPTARHGTACGECPCVTRTGPDLPPYQLTLDYEPGCVPTSGLLPTLLRGHTQVAWTGAEAVVAWSDLFVRLEDPVTGELGGPVARDGAATVIEAAGDFAIGSQPYRLELDLVVDELGATADGWIDVGGATVDLDGVALPYEGIRAACPTPDAGTATLQGREDPDVVVRFARPGGGRVTVERDERISEAVDLCAYGSDRL